MSTNNQSAEGWSWVCGMGHVLGNIVLCKWKWGKKPLLQKKKPNRKMAELMEINSGNVERAQIHSGQFTFFNRAKCGGESESAKWWMEWRMGG
jgi:hypothetical protein